MRVSINIKTKPRDKWVGMKFPMAGICSAEGNNEIYVLFLSKKGENATGIVIKDTPTSASKIGEFCNTWDLNRFTPVKEGTQITLTF